MTALVLADARDLRGFRLAGVPAVACRTPREVADALRRVGADTLVLVSAAVYELDRSVIDAACGRPGGPIALVMPEPGSVDA